MQEEEDLFVSEGVYTGSPDPVESEVPVYLNADAGDNLVLLQYPTRKIPSSNLTSSVYLKPESQVLDTEIESRVPSTYVQSSDGGVSSHFGLKQRFSGVLNENNGRFAVARLHDGALHLTLVPRTGQMRPKFPSAQASTPSSASSGAAGVTGMAAQPAQQSQAALRSVQMSVKSTSAEQPKHSGVLEFWRQANKEEYEPYIAEEASDIDRIRVLATKAADADDRRIQLDYAEQVNFV